MFIKELANAILPWWILVCILLGQVPCMHIPLLLIGAYLLATEIQFKKALRESKEFGFKRIVRIPVYWWVLRLLSRGRFSVPAGVPCYTLHIVSERLPDPRAFFTELAADIREGVEEEAFYLGNTFADLEHRINRVLGWSLVKSIDGNFFPGHTWNVDPESQQRLLFGRSFSKKQPLTWKILIIDTRRSQK